MPDIGKSFGDDLEEQFVHLKRIRNSELTKYQTDGGIQSITSAFAVWNKWKRNQCRHASGVKTYMQLRKQDGKYYEPLKLEVAPLLISLLWNIMRKAAGDRTLH